MARSISLVQMLIALLLAWWLLPAARASPLALLLTVVAFMLLLHFVLMLAGFAIAIAAASPVPAALRIDALGWIALVANEYLASLASIAIRVPLFGDRPLPSALTPSRVPVLLIHGYCCNRAIWRPLARHLANQGHPIGSVNLEPVFGTIDNYADQIAREIDSLQTRHRGEPVALIGHSMGGLAARAYLRRHGAAKLARVITIGTPHQGTALAHGPARNVNEMRLHSAWLRSLAASETEATGKRFSVILSHHDNIVSPALGQTIAGATTIELSGIGHLRMILDPKVWQRIDSVLSDAVQASVTADANRHNH